MKGDPVRRIGMLTLAGLAVVAATGPASADPVCRELTVGTQMLQRVCVSVEPGQSGTTVTPVITVTCASDVVTLVACDSLAPIAPGTFGIAPSPSVAPPVVDPATGSVKTDGGGIGTLYLGSSLPPEPLSVPPVCVGDPTYCHS